MPEAEPQRRPPPGYDLMVRRRKSMLVLTAIGVVAGLGLSIASLVALAQGRDAALFLVFWVVVTLVNVRSLRQRIAVVRDPESEQRRLEERYRKVVAQPRGQLLLKAGLVGFAMSIASIALGVTIALNSGDVRWLGWLLIVLGAGLAASTAYRLRRPAFDRD